MGGLCGKGKQDETDVDPKKRYGIKGFHDSVVGHLKETAKTLKKQPKIWANAIAKLDEKVFGVDIGDELKETWEDIQDETEKISDDLANQIEKLAEEALIAFLESVTDALEEGATL